jgi:hypothetical protein
MLTTRGQLEVDKIVEIGFVSSSVKLWSFGCSASWFGTRCSHITDREGVETAEIREIRGH